MQARERGDHGPIRNDGEGLGCRPREGEFMLRPGERGSGACAGIFMSAGERHGVYVAVGGEGRGWSLRVRGDFYVGATEARSLEVDQVVLTWDPGGHRVLDLVDLGSEAFMLYKSAEGFRIADQPVLRHGGYEHAGAEGALIVLTGDGVHLTRALEVDVLAFTLIGIESVVGGHHDETGESKVVLFVPFPSPISDIK